MLELRDLIFHVLRLAGPRGVNRTMLVKLAYFAELEHWRRFAEPLTDTPFRLYNYGAWAPEVVHVAEHESDFIEHSHLQSFHWQHNYKLKADPKVEPLPAEIEDLLQEVVATYGRKAAKEIGTLSKQTEPMMDAQPGRRLDLSVVAPRKPRLRVRSDRLHRGQISLDRSQRGRRAELDARDAEEIAAWRPARQRAAQAQNGMSSS